jgi:hypothetical protein
VNAPDRVASILRDSLDIWNTQGKRLHDRSRTKPLWSPEDIVGDTTDLMEHLTPLVEQTIQLGLDLVRPWAVQFEARTKGAGEAAAPVVAPEPVVVPPKTSARPKASTPKRTPRTKATGRTPAAKPTEKKGRPRA